MATSGERGDYAPMGSFPAGHLLMYDTPIHSVHPGGLIDQIMADPAAFGLLTTGEATGTLDEVRAGTADPEVLRAAAKGVVQNNAYSYDTGMLLFHHYSLLNHACPTSKENNCCYSEVGSSAGGRAVKLVTLKPIAVGDPIRVSYYRAFESRAVRAQVLTAHCGREDGCNCSACLAHDGAADDPDMYTLCMRPRVCKSCGAAPVTLLACTRCRQVVYCARACQKKHWGKHKGPCAQRCARPLGDGDGDGDGDGAEERERREEEFGREAGELLERARASMVVFTEGFTACTAKEEAEGGALAEEFAAFFDKWTDRSQPLHAAKGHQKIQEVLLTALSLAIRVLAYAPDGPGRRDGAQGQRGAASLGPNAVRVSMHACQWIRWRSDAVLAKVSVWHSEHFHVLLQTQCVLNRLRHVKQRLPPTHPVVLQHQQLLQELERHLPVLRLYDPEGAREFISSKTKKKAGTDALDTILSQDPAKRRAVEALCRDSSLTPEERSARVMAVLGDAALSQLKNKFSDQLTPPGAALAPSGASGEVGGGARAVDGNGEGHDQGLQQGLQQGGGGREESTPKEHLVDDEDDSDDGDLYDLD